MDVTINAPGCEPVHTMTEALERVTRDLERRNRSRRRAVEGMSDAASLANEMAAEGLISPEAAAETGRIAKAVSEKFAPTLQDEPATRFAKDQLKAIIERIERLEEEKKTISDDIRDVYAEAKGNGFDVKALRTIVRMRKQDPNERAEEETILETYMQALGML